MDPDLQRDLLRLGLSSAEAEALARGDSENLGAERSFRLVALDVDAVQAHVFASPRPITIEGASARLREWDAELRDLVEGQEGVALLFVGGGNAVLVTREAACEPFLAAAREAFEKAVPGASLSSEHIDVSLRELASGPSSAPAVPKADVLKALGYRPQGGGGFGACLARLQLALRRKKLAARSHPFLTEPTTAARCAECAEHGRVAGDRRGLCERCGLNRARGGKVKSDVRWQEAKSFDDVLGEGEDRARHVAFIRLDGKGIGAVLESLQTIAQYRAVSDALRAAFELDAERVKGLGVPENRYQLPISGGDDLLLIVPGRWKARRGARTIG